MGHPHGGQQLATTVSITAALAYGRRFVLVNGFGSGTHWLDGHGPIEIHAAGVLLTGHRHLAGGTGSPLAGKGYQIGGKTAAAQAAGAAQALAVVAVNRRHL